MTPPSRVPRVLCCAGRVFYPSHVVEWRRARDAGALDGVTAQPPARGRSPEQTENERLRRELAKTQAALDVWGKGIRALLGLVSESADTETRSKR